MYSSRSSDSRGVRVWERGVGVDAESEWEWECDDGPVVDIVRVVNRLKVDRWWLMSSLA